MLISDEINRLFCYSVEIFLRLIFLFLPVVIIVCPFYALYLVFKGLTAEEIIISFYNEIINNVILYNIRFMIANFLVSGGLITHKAYLKYVVNKLEMEKFEYIYFKEYLNEL